MVQPGEQPDISALLQQAQVMQQQLFEAQEKIASSQVTGQAGNGLVRATVSGSGDLLALTIDPSVVDPSDVETLQDLVIGAIADANESARNLAAESLGPLAGGMPGLPGFPG